MEMLTGENLIEITFGIILFLTLLLAGIAFYKVILWEKKFKILFQGKTLNNLEDKLFLSLKKVEEAISNDLLLEKRIKQIEMLLNKSITKKAILRYNPFNEVGSNQSFSLCLLDSELNGVIISALYSRGVSNFYSKEINKGISKYNLSDEEKEVLALAIAN